MDQTPDAFAAALSSGDTDRVNRAIDSVDDMELEERAALFDDCFERCRDLYASDNVYQRQSVVRFAAALYPGLAFRTVRADQVTLPSDGTKSPALITPKTHTTVTSEAHHSCE